MLRRFVWVGLIGALSAAATADITFQTSFESPDYALGNLNGQDGWTTSATNPEAYIISDARAHTGAQSLMSDQAQNTGGSRWAWQTFDAAFTATSHPGQTVLHASVWIYMEATTSTASWFGLDLWSNGVVNRAAGIQLQVGNIDFYDRSLNGGAGSWVTVADGSIVANEWHHLEFFADLATSQTWAVINGTTHSVTGTLTYDNIDEVDLFTFKESGSTQRGFYDDYSLQVVPEPATLAALSAGVALLARRRKRS